MQYNFFMKRVKYLIAGLFLGFVAFAAVGIYIQRHLPLSLADLFRENIEYKFYAYATQITGKQRLQVAKLQETEVFERTSQAKAFWIDLPDVVVKAVVPVEYGFFVEMNQGWKFQLVGDEVLVEVPALTNSTPAVDISRLQFEVVKGGLLRNEKKEVEKLQKELMAMLVEKSIEYRAKVRSEARASIEQFVKGWLTQMTGKLPSEKVKVRFADEAESTTLQ